MHAYQVNSVGGRWAMTSAADSRPGDKICCVRTTTGCDLVIGNSSAGGAFFDYEVAVVNINDQDRELALITSLCRELARLGLTVSLSDARPTAMIPNAFSPRLTVTVDLSGKYFAWGDPQERYTVADTAGAARRVQERVKAQRLGSGEAS